MQLKVRKSELLKCLAVGDSGEDVSHSDGSLGEGVGEVLLGEGTVTAVSSDEGSEGGGDLAVELAEVVLVEDEGFVSLIGLGAWEGGVDLVGLVEDSVNPLLGSGDVLVGSGGVVVSQVEEGVGVVSELVESLDGVSDLASGGDDDEGGGELHIVK